MQGGIMIDNGLLALFFQSVLAIGNSLSHPVKLILILILIALVVVLRKFKIEGMLLRLLNAILVGAIIGCLGFTLGFFGPKILDSGNTEGGVSK